MIKRIITSLLALLLVAGGAYAIEMDTTGEFYARGSYISNHTGLISDDVPSYGYYDSELDMTVTLKVSDYTKIITNFEIHDQDWLQSELDGSTYSGTVTDDTFVGEDLDDNIEFKRVFSSHAFSNGTVLDLGLMTGGAWGTKFADNADGTWRVKALHNASFGTVGGVLQKAYESGAIQPTVEDAEKDDGDAYYLFGIFPVSTHKIMPLLIYANRSDVDPAGDDDGLKVMGIHLAAAGAFGSTLGYEAEFNFMSYNADYTNGTDYDLIGSYVNMWTTMGAAKLGGQVAYGSWDKDASRGFGFGEDYTPTMFGADFASIGSTSKSEYSAVTLAQLYVQYAMSESLSLYGNGTYWMSNEEDTAWEDANGYEIDLGGDYKITPNVTYGVLAAFGQITQDEDAPGGVDDADNFYRLYHKFTISF